MAKPHIAWPWIVVAVCAVGAISSLGAKLARGRRGPPGMLSGVANVPSDGGAACDLSPLRLRPLSQAGQPPFLLRVPEGIRVRVDELPVAASAELKLELGARSLEVLAREKVVMRTVIEVREFEPVLLHVTAPPELGVLPLRLGGVCRDCLVPLAPVTLGVENPQPLVPPLFRDAAGALRHDDWTAAARSLRSVPAKLRVDAFDRLAAMTFAAARMPQSAAESAQHAARWDRGLGEALEQWKRLTRAEAERRDMVRMERWNRLTEQFAALLQRYDQHAPGASEQTSRRLEALGAAMKTAADAQTQAEAEDVLEAAQLAVDQWLRLVQSSHPADCEFQRALREAVVAGG